MDLGTQLAVAGGAAALGALSGLLVPPLVRRLPEPSPESLADVPEDEPPKVPYAELSREAGLTARCALAAGVAGGLTGLAVGWSWLLVLLLPLVPVGVALSFVDLRTRLLPKVLVLPATAYVVAVAGIAAAVTTDPTPLLRGVIGLVVARSVFWLMWYIHSAGMGFGDVRLSALTGFALGVVGWPEYAVGLYAGFVLFGVPGLVLAVVRRSRAELRVARPYGPFLLAGALLGLVAGDPIAGLVTG